MFVLALLVTPAPSSTPTHVISCVPYLSTPTPAQNAADYAVAHKPCKKNTGWTWVFEGDGCAPVDVVPFPRCPPPPPTPVPGKAPRV